MHDAPSTSQSFLTNYLNLITDMMNQHHPNSETYPKSNKRSKKCWNMMPGGGFDGDI